MHVAQGLRSEILSGLLLEELRMSQFQLLFPRPFPLIGVVHLKALPGSPRHTLPMEALIAHAEREARALVRAGFDGIVVENFGDAPFFPDRVEPVTVSAMSILVHAVMEVVRNESEGEGLPVGVNVLRNDALGALAIAATTGAQFIRVNVLSGAMITDQGLVQGRAAEVLRLRRALGVESVCILADVLVKHATPIGEPDLVATAKDTFLRGGAEALILSGSGTGAPTELGRLETIRGKMPEAPLLIGSGLTLESLEATVKVAQGAIVGTALKEGGLVENMIEERRARELVARRNALCRRA